jgi:molybdopterin/thiamine biosynthesis adenylyltransferase
MSTPTGLTHTIPGLTAQKIQDARVMVVGAGALGNEVLKNLALLGVSNIVIVDFDHIELSNLSRSILYRAEDAKQGRLKAETAAERLLEINPDLHLLTLLGDVVTDLSIGLIMKMDVVIGCVDNRLARLYLNRLCWRADVPWIDGGILNFSGQVATYVPGHSCYECGLTPTAWKEIRQRLGCTDMARRYALDGQSPTTVLAASMVGAMQVQEALKLIAGDGANSLDGKMWSFEGRSNYYQVYENMPIQLHCDSHHTYEEVISAPFGAGATVAELFAWLRKEHGIQTPVLLLDHSLILRLVAMGSKREIGVMVPTPHFSDRLARELSMPTDGVLAVPAGGMVEEIEDEARFGAVQLWNLGIPLGHVLRVGRGAERRLVFLSADRHHWEFRAGVYEIPNPWWQREAAEVYFHSK